MADNPDGPPVPPASGGFGGWLDRTRSKARDSLDEARRLWAERNRARATDAGPANEDETPARGNLDEQAPTQQLPAVPREARRHIRPRQDVAGEMEVDDAEGDALPPAAVPNALAAAWSDATRRVWLIIGAVAIVLVLALIVAGPPLSRRLGVGGGTAIARPAPTAPGAGLPAPEQPPAVQPGQPAPAVAERATRALGLAALPLLLGLFWLLSAWLVDAEARRAFVVQEPWGERRTVAYSCLAVGCVFPLILAGLLFAAYGFVSFVLFVANRQSWVAGVQAGALILIACASFLLMRSALARYLAERRSRS